MSGDGKNIAIREYLYTTGGTAFLDANATSIIKANVPPQVSGAGIPTSTVVLSMPHLVDVSPETEPAPISGSPAFPVRIFQASLRTPDVYPDLCRIDVVYSIFPNIEISLTALSPEMLITPPGGGSAIPFSCDPGAGSYYDQSNGMGACRIDEPTCSSSMFTSFTGSLQQATMQMRAYDAANGNAELLSTPEPVNLHPNLASTSAAGASTTLGRGTVIPRAPIRRSGEDTYTLSIVTSTAGNILGSWAVDITYNHTRVTYSSVQLNTALFSQLVVSPQQGFVPIFAQRDPANTNDAQYNGDSIHLMDVVFNVAGPLPANDEISITSGPAILYAEIRFLSNIGSNDFIQNQPITFDDFINVGSVGTAHIEFDKPPGLMVVIPTAYPKHVVLKPDGTPISTTVTATALFSGYRSPDVSIPSNELECTSLAPTKIQVGSPGTTCVNISPLPTTSPVTTEFPPTVQNPWGMLQVEYLNAVIPPGVVDPIQFGSLAIPTHIATSIQIQLFRSSSGHSSSNVLEKRCSSTAADGYQMARLRKMVVFDSGSGTPSVPVDVSNTFYDIPIEVDPGSANPGSIQIVDSFFVLGLAAGTASIRPVPVSGLGDGRTYISQTVQVSDTYDGQSTGAFAQVSVITMQDVEWYTGIGTQNLNPLILDKNPLTDEGDAQLIFPTYQPAGFILPKAQNEAIIASVASTNTQVYTITTTSGPASYPYWYGEIPVGALTTPVQEVVPFVTTVTAAEQALLPTQRCELLQGFTNISLPTPVSATLTITRTKFAMLNDEADGIAAPSASLANEISLQVSFSDGSNKVQTGDSRTAFEFDVDGLGNTYSPTNANGASFALNPTTNVAFFTAPNTGGHQVISFRAQAMNGLATSNAVTVTIVVATGLTNAVESIETRSFGTQTTTLRRVHCAPSVFQGLRVVAAMQISDGTQVSPLAQGSGIAYNHQSQGTLRKVGHDVFMGESPGFESIVSTFGSLTAAVTPITVDTNSVYVQDLTIASIGPSDMLKGVPTSTLQTLQITMILSDGERIADIVSSYTGYTATDIFDANNPGTHNNAIHLFSDNPASILLNTNGQIQLLANAASRVTITAEKSQLTCAGEPGTVAQGTLAVAPNLVSLSQGDVDLGQASGGLPVPAALSTSSDTVIQVRVRSNTNLLRGFDVSVTYDPANVIATGCQLETSAWTGGCNFDSIPGSIQLAGGSPSFAGPSGGQDGTVIGTVTLRAASSNNGVVNTPISGIVTEVAVENLGVIVSSQAFIAGNIPIQADTGNIRRRRRNMLSAEEEENEDEKPRIILPMHKRSLLQFVPYTYGDVDGVSGFNIQDLIFVIEYYNSAPQMGCPAQGGNGCTLRSSLTQQQLAQIKPINESSTGARDIPYLFNVFLGKSHFVADTSFVVPQPNQFILRVRLVDKDGSPVLNTAPSVTRILYVLDTTQQSLPWLANAELASSSYDVGNSKALATVTTAAGADGWFQLEARATNVGNVFSDESNVGIVFAIEVLNAQSQTTPDSRFPFYSTVVGDYAAFYTNFRPYATINIDGDPSFIPGISGPPTTTPVGPVPTTTAVVVETTTSASAPVTTTPAPQLPTTTTPPPVVTTTPPPPLPPPPPPPPGQTNTTVTPDVAVRVVAADNVTAFELPSTAYSSAVVSSNIQMILTQDGIENHTMEKIPPNDLLIASKTLSVTFVPDIKPSSTVQLIMSTLDGNDNQANVVRRRSSKTRRLLQQTNTNDDPAQSRIHWWNSIEQRWVVIDDSVYDPQSMLVTYSLSPQTVQLPGFTWLFVIMRPKDRRVIPGGGGHYGSDPTTTAAPASPVTTPPPPASTPAADEGGGGGVSVGIIAGGAVGGGVFLCCLFWILFFVLRKRSSARNKVTPGDSRPVENLSQVRPGSEEAQLFDGTFWRAFTHARNVVHPSPSPFSQNSKHHHQFHSGPSTRMAAVPKSSSSQSTGNFEKPRQNLAVPPQPFLTSNNADEVLFGGALASFQRNAMKSGNGNSNSKGARRNAAANSGGVGRPNKGSKRN